MVPTRPRPDGGFHRAWRARCHESEAVRAAQEFFAANGVPVLVRREDEHGTARTTVGIFTDRKLRSDRRRRR
jgi:hypothetical protein